MPKTKDVEAMDLEELKAERDALAVQRTELRLRQRAVEEAIMFQEALGGFPPELQQRVHLASEVGAKGAH